MIIENKFDLKQTVYLETDSQNLKRKVIGIKACADGGLLYELATGIDISWHYECEILNSVDKQKIGFAL